MKSIKLLISLTILGLAISSFLKDTPSTVAKSNDVVNEKLKFNAVCTSNEQCDKDYVCKLLKSDSKDKTCEVSESIGISCKTKADCKDGLKCIKDGEKETCQKKSPSRRSGEAKENGQECASENECKSSICQEDKDTKKKICKARTNKLRIPEVPKPKKALGATCDEKKVDECDANLTCRKEKKDSRETTCQDTPRNFRQAGALSKGKNGDICTEDSECQSSNCGKNEKICKEKPKFRLPEPKLNDECTDPASNVNERERKGCGKLVCKQDKETKKFTCQQP